jgi:hypothetical protein
MPRKLIESLRGICNLGAFLVKYGLIMQAFSSLFRRLKSGG